MAVFENNDFDETFFGVAGEYNQVDYRGSLSEFRIYRNEDGSVTVEHPTLGTDTLFDIDGFWFGADSSWYSIDDAIAMTDGAAEGENFRIDRWGNLIGTDGDDRLVDTAETSGLYGGRGDDRLVGREDAYSQGAFDGSASDYTITVAENGNVIFTHPIFGRDTLSNIDGIWFGGEARWYALEDLLPNQTVSEFRVDAWGNLIGTEGDDTLVDTTELSGLYGGRGDDTLIGLSDAYSQGAFNGAAIDYTITEAANGNVIFDHPVWGTDTLIDIDGIWFTDEARWYAIDDLIDDAPRQETGTLIDGVLTGSDDVDDFIVGTNANDTFYVGRGNDIVEGSGGDEDVLRIDGDIIEWTFTLQNDGSLVMTHPTWGQNIVTGVETLFSVRAGRDYTIDEALQLTDQLPEFRLDADNVLNGTNGDDVMVGAVEGTNFYGGLGDDVFTGSGRNFDQINYDGDRSEYNFTQNADGSITAEHPIWGVDTFTDIEGLFFNGTDNGGEFILVEDLFG